MTRAEAETELVEVAAAETLAWAKCKALTDVRDVHMSKLESERQIIAKQYADKIEVLSAAWRPLFARRRQLNAFLELT